MKVLPRTVAGWLVSMAVAACGSDDALSYDVSVELYIESHCEVVCAMNRDCQRPFYESAAQCRAACVEGTEFELTDEKAHCFELEVEFNRCRFERLSCEEIFEPESSEQPLDSPCREQSEEWRECVGIQ